MPDKDYTFVPDLVQQVTTPDKGMTSCVFHTIPQSARQSMPWQRNGTGSKNNNAVRSLMRHGHSDVRTAAWQRNYTAVKAPFATT